MKKIKQHLIENITKLKRSRVRGVSPECNEINKKADHCNECLDEVLDLIKGINFNYLKTPTKDSTVQELIDYIYKAEQIAAYARYTFNKSCPHEDLRNARRMIKHVMDGLYENIVNNY